MVVKILRLFPDINPDWLLLDGSEMLRSSASFATMQQPTTPTIFSSPSEPLFDVEENIESMAGENSTKNSMPAILQSSKNSGKRVERVIILYSDRTFETFTE